MGIFRKICGEIFTKSGEKEKGDEYITKNNKYYRKILSITLNFA